MGNSQSGENAAVREMTPEVIANYSELFLLLHTEPMLVGSLLQCLKGEKEWEESFDSFLVSLFGVETTPREELCILSIFKYVIEEEVKKATYIDYFNNSDRILFKMVTSYSKHKQGKDFLCSTFTAPVLKLLNMDVDLEQNGRKIYQALIRQENMHNGKRLDPLLTDEEIAVLPEVREVVQERAKNLQEICQMFFDAILESIERVPYGIRWICKQLVVSNQRAMPNVTEAELNRLASSFVFDYFLSLGVVRGGVFGIFEGKVDPQFIFNLIEVNKVLSHVFRLSTFSPRIERWYVNMNDWVKSHFGAIDKVVHDLDIGNPEDLLENNNQEDCVKPISISIKELAKMHQILYDNYSCMESDADNQLGHILKKFGRPASWADEERIIDLSLYPELERKETEEPKNDQDDDDSMFID